MFSPLCRRPITLLMFAALAFGYSGLGGCAVAETPASAADADADRTASSTETGLGGPTPVAASAQDYAAVCGICHLASGAGIPGAFPGLDSRLAAVAQSDAGRDYLVGILFNGLYGLIEVNGSRYNGSMPPLGAQLSDSQAAGLLYYVVAQFGGDATSATFTEAEVTARKSSVGSTSSADLRTRVASLQ